MIDKITVDKILDAANIVDVVSEFVSLRKSGANYKGLCPFHDERTPSFYVSPARGICKCFSCGKGGSPVGFIMEHEQMTYPEALKWLARKYNIEVKERELSDDEKREQNDRESMFIVNEWASGYFEDILQNDVDGLAIGKQYLRSRGFRDDIIKKFRLGYSLSKRDSMSLAALRNGYKEEFLVKTGLSYKRDSGELVDRYAGRVIFPWIGLNGKVVAFGGRVLDTRTKGVNQKYVNSPDSDIYHKDHELYGIYQAKRSIAKEDCVYMVEGYMDVIAMHQSGIENVVANSGTALSIHQIRTLHRFTPNIVLLYDSDTAGIHAALRGTDMLLAEGMNVKVLMLPEDEDPDSFSRKHTAEDFRQYIEEHKTDFIVFKTKLLLDGETDPIKRSEAISGIVRSISVIRDQIVRDTYIKECSHRMNISEQTLIDTMNRFIYSDREKERKEQKRESNATPLQPISKATPVEHSEEIEKMLIEVVIRHGNEIMLRNVELEDDRIADVSVADFVYMNMQEDGLSFANELYNRILGDAFEHPDDENFVAEDYFLHHEDIEISSLAASMSLDEVLLSKSLQMETDEDKLKNKVLHLLLDFRLNYAETRLEELKRQLSLANGDMEKTMEIMKEIQTMQAFRNKIAKEIGSNIIA